MSKKIYYASDTLICKGRSHGSKQWRVEAFTEETEGGDIVAYVMTEYGKVGGSLRRDVKMISPTSTKKAIDIAITRAKAKEKSKRKKGYSETGESKLSVQAMKAHDFSGNEGKISYPCFGQPKINGVWATYFDYANKKHEEVFLREAPERGSSPFKPHPESRKFKETLVSREGNIFEKMHGMANVIYSWFRRWELYKVQHLAGELYIPGYHVSDIVSAVKGENEELREKLKLYVFDYPDVEMGVPFFERLRRGTKFCRWNHPERPSVIEPVQTVVLHNRGELDHYYEKCLDAGMEGIIIRNEMGVFEWGERSWDIFKRKPVFSNEFTIVGREIYNAPGGKKQMVFVCLVNPAYGTETFKVRMKMSLHDMHTIASYDEETYNRLYVGKKLTVEYREVSKYGVPFHPVGITIRDYE